MRFSARVRPLVSPAFVLLILCLLPSLHAQAPQANRIAVPPDLTRTTRLTGHLPAWVTPSTDAGAVAADTPIRLTLLLSRTPTLQTAFEQLLADQQSPASPSFHQWLTPTQIGERFGPTPADLAAITQWLTTSGLQLAEISPSRTFVTVTGTAAVAAATFSTNFRLFTYNAQPHLSATSDPAIPTAFTSIVTSIEGLTDLPVHPLHRTQIAQPRTAPDSVQPLYSNAANTLHYVFPGDFATIYDLKPVTSAGYTGAGVKVAIIGRSQIANSDITQLQTLAGLPNKIPNVIIVPGTADPGVVSGDTGESTLDVSRVLTTATGAQADLLIASNATGGLSAGLQYNINTLLDPIMTLSYGLCEASAGAAAVNFFNTLFSQAAAEGISTFISSGDAGAAGCSPNFSTPTGHEILGMGNYLCSSSYVTCVGGTEFNDANAAAFWAPGPTTTPFSSALGYIPEGAWNEPTTTNAQGATLFQIAGSGGGPSAFIPKPFFQTGTGVPTDGARDIPDLAFTSSDHDGFFACLASSGSGYNCANGGGVIFSGTSAAAPSMAAIAAILNQRLGGNQGNLNPLLYSLTASSPSAFHDATPASSGVVLCTTATASLCNNSIPSPTSITGGLAGYPLQVGYDLVTGLGSLDVASFINAAASYVLNVASVVVSANPHGISAGQSTVFTATVTSAGAATPTGTVQFFSNGVSIGSAIALTDGVAISPSIAFPIAGTFAITAVYSGDNAYAASHSAPVAFIVSGLPATVTVAGASPTSLIAGQTITILSASVVSVGIGGPIPTGSVQFNANGKFLAGPVALIAGKATSPAILFATSGTDAITAVYSGDINYAASTSNVVNVVVNPVATTTTVMAFPSFPITAGAMVVLNATVFFPLAGNPTGTVQFYANGTAFGSPVTLTGVTAQTTAFSTKVAGTYAISAAYSGDATFAASTSVSASIIIFPQTTPPSLTLSASPTTLTLSSSAANTATTTITAITPVSFTGTVTLGCAVTPATTVPPACVLSASSLTFTSAQSATGTLTVSTITPHDRPSPITQVRQTPRLSASLKDVSLGVLLLTFMPALRRRRLPRRLPPLLAMLPLTLLLGAALLTLSGCGNSNGSVSSPPPPVLTGTTAAAYIVTITATSGTTTATRTVNLTIQ